VRERTYQTFHWQPSQASDQSYWNLFQDLISLNRYVKVLTGLVIATLNHKAMYSRYQHRNWARLPTTLGAFSPRVGCRSAKEKCFNFCKLFQLIQSEYCSRHNEPYLPLKHRSIWNGCESELLESMLSFMSLRIKYQFNFPQPLFHQC